MGSELPQTEDPPGLPEKTDAANPASVTPKLIDRMVAEFRGNFGGGSFLDKLSTTQLGRLIDQGEQTSKRQHELETQKIKLVFYFLLAVLIVILLLCWMFLAYGKGDLLREIIALLIGLTGGGAGGYTLGMASKKGGEA